MNLCPLFSLIVGSLNGRRRRIFEAEALGSFNLLCRVTFCWHLESTCCRGVDMIIKMALMFIPTAGREKSSSGLQSFSLPLKHSRNY